MIKISWGTGIVIGIVIFVTITFSMTIIFMTQDVNLVTDDYYEKTLTYQDEIDKKSRTKALNEEVKINFNGKMISILFPSDYLNKNISGEIYFYRPSNPALDFKIPLQLSQEGIQVIPVERIEKGFWRLKINWLMNEYAFYNERAITIK
ncbi:MAG: FixH family protein [Ignavibacteria bacterium]|nr:FixH family protein [Ignavibacteria bacterium]MBT8383577.1 FixH family protein [Ignavibacteria bacterium]MBT8390681.1 FixH family protein [Ignavibacteria bacterium]NNJ51719.1 FixH family protein [Ignavibacteriaceae bacterium]NNL20710.1 FixH family protein [Ignavibacteriaceae bacterium]